MPQLLHTLVRLLVKALVLAALALGTKSSRTSDALVRAFIRGVIFVRTLLARSVPFGQVAELASGTSRAALLGRVLVLNVFSCSAFEPCAIIIASIARIVGIRSIREWSTAGLSHVNLNTILVCKADTLLVKVSGTFKYTAWIIVRSTLCVDAALHTLYAWWDAGSTCSQGDLPLWACNAGL